MQVNSRALTKRYVDSLKPAAKAILAFDASLAGFGVRVMPSGHRSYFVQYRNKHGRSRWFTIGAHGPMTVDKARKIAKDVLHAVAEGKDPADARKAFRNAPDMGQLLDRYVAEHVRKHNKTTIRAELERVVERYIRPALKALKVAAVTRGDIEKLHRSLAGTPRQANVVRAVCSKVFSLAEVWEMRPEGTNPCRRIPRHPEQHRERFLSGDELARLGAVLRLAASDGLPWIVKASKATAKHLPAEHHRRTVYPRVTTATVELLLYTGCRLSEVLNLRWEHIDLDAGTILLPTTKSGRAQTVTINAPARQILLNLRPDDDAEWVLPGKLDSSKPLKKDAMEAAWQKIRAAADLADVHLHDLRHTVGTYAGQSGANAFLVRDLLRHSDLSMTGRYVNKSDDPVRTLNDLVGERIAAGLEGRPPAVVVPLRR
ncbi:site-specific integrase [Bradyrhizobium sp. Ash2021]|uniref:tyrosine-type recombinase/integrase n=1 Tax=Bradyrhizobium sp. Ash2021 TaxID=2954771 RepID=UPI002815E0BD|nr:site-specific integrase [Bradyrhizobium sp. Ash2021]WMT73934.1 site-specific integrase [Bradyrhizobium sp. Ash2021]